MKKIKETNIANNVERKNKFEGITLFDFKTYCKS